VEAPDPDIVRLTLSEPYEPLLQELSIGRARREVPEPGRHLSWHAPFAIYLIGVPLGLAALLALPNPAADPHATTGPRRRGRGEAFRLLRARPLLLGLCAIWVATAGLMMVLAVFLPRRLDQLGIQDTLLVAGLAYPACPIRLCYGSRLWPGPPRSPSSPSPVTRCSCCGYRP
jgi:hypothetical protein